MIVTFVLLLIFGWALGSALNYLADVLPFTRSFSSPVCQHCGSDLTFREYALYKPCPNCTEARGTRTWVILILAILCTPLVYFFPPERFGFWISLPYLFYFALIALIDIEHRVILRETILAGLVITIPIGIMWNGWINTLLGALVGFGAMTGTYYLGVLFNRIASKKRGVPIEEVAFGYGDVNLSAILGIFLGWPKIGIGLFVSIMLAGLLSGFYVVISLIGRKYQAFTAIPYAPFLVFSAVILLYLA
ncbi:MAG: prepilin peptidase [Ignavibacteriaceae bacterium]